MNTPIILINRTFETVTPESAEEGDFADSGFLAENEEVTFRELVDLMRDHPQSSSSGTPSPWDWFSTHWETSDYSTGEERSEAIHFSRENPERLAKYWTKAAEFAGVAFA